MKRTAGSVRIFTQGMQKWPWAGKWGKSIFLPRTAESSMDKNRLYRCKSWCGATWKSFSAVIVSSQQHSPWKGKVPHCPVLRLMVNITNCNRNRNHWKVEGLTSDRMSVGNKPIYSDQVVNQLKIIGISVLIVNNTVNKLRVFWLISEQVNRESLPYIAM